ncbi:SusC/RagA family TonB-linked outer membrane protein [Catalinimonas sp. 4WD22]|uniref:SusC/RagA family TonB-linked outer membrane protein n=1 Tax=Catalinimonas locisalis TaxID=3133978 RepID=UPI0031010C94
MKKQLLILTLMIASVTYAMAQRQITGRIIDSEDNGPLPGVNVLVKGTTTGTVSDIDGNYSISVSGDNAILTFSSIGYSTQEITVGNQSTINVQMAADVQSLQEVVVTALGVEREKKALGYSITEVDGSNLTEAREINVANALAGRVAGVNVSNIASGPAGSTRVIIRGNKSLQGNNQPLYVVDGVPMDNSGFGQAGIWGGRDEGDGMSSINPDDIASISVLKGASAAALYGARAANGVINIVTKKGSARKGIGIEFNSNFVFEQYNDQRDFQREYGQGGYAASDPNDPESPRIAVAPRTQQEAYSWGTSSWGPRLGSVANSIHFDGVTRPYTDAGDNWERYFQTGYTLTNTISFTGGSETQNFRLSISDLRNESIVPNSGFNRQNVTLATNSKFGERLTLTSRILYSHEYANNRPYLSDSPANGILSMYYIPANINVRDYYGDPEKPGAIPPTADPASLSIWGKSVGEEYQQANNNWHQNPYWTAYQFNNDDWRDRLLPSATLRYDVLDFLWVQARVGMDWYTRRETDLVPQGTGYQRGGSLTEAEDRVREINMEWMMGFDKEFGKFNVNAFVGANRMRRSSERIAASGNGFNVPFFEAITNTVTQNFGYGFSESGINSLFGSAELSYDGILFLTGTVRNDWFSVLNPENNSILYPSISGSFVFSDALDELPNWLSFGKVRASWAQVGNVTVGPYNTLLTYSLKQAHLGYTMASFSSAGGQNGSIPNPGLLPLTSTEYEIGMDVRFLDNRLGLDFTYYNQRTTDDILNATISRASGFGSTVVNVGELENKGIEFLLTGTPIQGPLTWDVSLNFAKNNNKVISLIEGNDELIVEEPRTRTVFVKHIVGQPFGVLTGLVQKRSPDGQLVFDPNNGAPIQSDGYEIIGNGVPDFTGGINNSFTFKNFNLSALIDFKMGGDIYSGTNVRMTQAGLHKQTILGREGQEAITVTGVAQNGTTESGDPIYEPFTRTLTPNEAQNYWNQMGNRVQDHFVYDASFAKLRQLTFGYNFPASMLENMPFRSLSLSFVARNLAILYKNTENIDPESTYSNSNGQGLDYFGMPRTRSYGFNLRVAF